MAELKRATADQHRAIENELAWLSDAVTVPKLAWVLGRFHTFFEAWEPQAEASVEETLPGFFPPRRKLDLLTRDLAELGCAVGPAESVNVRGITEWPSVLGAMYVVEGSTLGGQFIARAIERRLGLSQSKGYSYFVGYGSRTGEMWRGFSSVVNGAGPDVAPEVVSSARATFEILHAKLSAGGVIGE
jgi:heme oxygenase (biliverdin-IX-beta and delta-forming)